MLAMSASQFLARGVITHSALSQAPRVTILLRRTEPSPPLSSIRYGRAVIKLCNTGRTPLSAYKTDFHLPVHTSPPDLNGAILKCFALQSGQQLAHGVWSSDHIDKPKNIA
jgi:hypothetical protein